MVTGTALTRRWENWEISAYAEEVLQIAKATVSQGPADSVPPCVFTRKHTSTRKIAIDGHGGL